MSLMMIRLLPRRALFRAVGSFNRKKRAISSSSVKALSVVPIMSSQNDSFTTKQLDQRMTTVAMALLLTSAATLGNIACGDGHGYSIATCEARAETSPAQWNPPRPVSRREFKPTDQPRNVMLHRMRSVRARNLQEKYDIAWKTKLGEGAYGSVYPGRLSATGEKVRSAITFNPFIFAMRCQEAVRDCLMVLFHSFCVLDKTHAIRLH